jgi:TPR repeat protein
MPVDYEWSMYLVRVASNRGVANEKCNIGIQYENGMGVLVDIKLPVRWYSDAAVDGSAIALHNLGLLYLNGNSEAVDHYKALHYFSKAMENNYAPSLYYLGFIHKSGLAGENPDYKQAQIGMDKVLPQEEMERANITLHYCITMVVAWDRTMFVLYIYSERLLIMGKLKPSITLHTCIITMKVV